MSNAGDKPVVTQCPNPWCNSRKTVDREIRAAEAPIVMASRSGAEWAVACPVCPIQTPWFETEAEAIAAWNTRHREQDTLSREGREAVAYLYESDDGSQELVLDCNGEYAQQLIKLGWTETPLAALSTAPASPEHDVDRA